MAYLTPAFQPRNALRVQWNLYGLARLGWFSLGCMATSALVLGLVALRIL